VALGPPRFQTPPLDCKPGKRERPRPHGAGDRLEAEGGSGRTQEAGGNGTPSTATTVVYGRAGRSRWGSEPNFTVGVLWPPPGASDRCRCRRKIRAAQQRDETGGSVRLTRSQPPGVAEAIDQGHPTPRRRRRARARPWAAPADRRSARRAPRPRRRPGRRNLRRRSAASSSRPRRWCRRTRSRRAVPQGCQDPPRERRRSPGTAAARGRLPRARLGPAGRVPRCSGASTARRAGVGEQSAARSPRKPDGAMPASRHRGRAQRQGQHEDGVSGAPLPRQAQRAAPARVGAFARRSATAGAGSPASSGSIAHRDGSGGLALPPPPGKPAARWTSRGPRASRGHHEQARPAGHGFLSGHRAARTAANAPAGRQVDPLPSWMRRIRTCCPRLPSGASSPGTGQGARPPPPQ
jgi:hypothetical protein